mmetsp:Transcript_3203/g.11160  ORF Transcript_3203/g.11160 Transcript_3203/m.11160 type:complete len:230 (-) Transcript_3203:737-1426(-)
MENPRDGDTSLASVRAVSNPRNSTNGKFPDPLELNASTAPSVSSTRRRRVSHARCAHRRHAFLASDFCRPYTNDRVSTFRAQWLESAWNALACLLAFAFKRAVATFSRSTREPAATWRHDFTTRRVCPRWVSASPSVALASASHTDDHVWNASRVVLAYRFKRTVKSKDRNTARRFEKRNHALIKRARTFSRRRSETRVSKRHLVITSRATTRARCSSASSRAIDALTC